MAVKDNEVSHLTIGKKEAQDRSDSLEAREKNIYGMNDQIRSTLPYIP